MWWQIFYAVVMINILINYIINNKTAKIFFILTVALGMVAIIEYHYRGEK